MGFDEKKVVEFPVPKTFAYRANIDQLAESTLKLLKNDRLQDRMGKEAAKHAIENFHYKVVARKMRDLIMKRVYNKEPEIAQEIKVSE
jgi:glycosyltransferase involved in cell wall biosynthesis